MSQRTTYPLREEAEMSCLRFLHHPAGFGMVAVMWRNIADLALFRCHNLSERENVERQPFSLGPNGSYDRQEFFSISACCNR
jgi:hypothetical protein